MEELTKTEVRNICRSKLNTRARAETNQLKMTTIIEMMVITREQGAREGKEPGADGTETGTPAGKRRDKTHTEQGKLEGQEQQ